MTLYYAPAVFFYLLGRCFSLKSATKAFQGVFYLGITVITCFIALWWPFVYYGPEDTSYRERALHVLRRIFPLQRGLFEGKVSNLWCAFSVKPFRIRQRIPNDLQPVVALLLTVILLVPVCYHMFRAGQRSPQSATMAHIHQRQLLWGATNSALAFFLASFQVHEKSLLLALAPCSLLMGFDPVMVEWFSIVAAWTMWPLLQIDRLQTAYVCTLSIFGAGLCLRREWLTSKGATIGFFDRKHFGLHSSWIPVLSYFVMIGLHLAELLVEVPTNMPDLFPVLWSIVGCGFCCLAWLITAWRLFGIERELSAVLEQKQKAS